MQITLANRGKAIIHFTRARSMFQDKYAKLANCARCDEGLKDSLKEGVAMFETLLVQLKELEDE